MRIAIASEFGNGLSWWKRLADEGHEVLVWIKPLDGNHVGEGIVPRTNSWETLFQFAKTGVLARRQTMMLFDSSGLGEKADEARSWGIPIIGGCGFADRLEKDRAFGFRIAEEAGILIPPHEQFESFADALMFVQDMSDTPIYFKSDRFLDSDATHGADTTEEMVEYLEYVIRTYGSHGKCIIQQKIEGVPVSTARWWNGQAFVGPYQCTLEHKKFLNDDLGPSTGCAMNALWFYQDTPRISQELHWEALSHAFRKNAAAPGLYDANCVVTPQGESYFLEWTPRLGYDSEMTSHRLFPSLGGLLEGVCFGRSEPAPSPQLAYSIRLGVPPYPWEHSKKVDQKSCVGTYVSGDVGDLWSESFIGYDLRIKDGHLEVASPEGIVGLTYAQGHRLGQLNEECIEAAKKIRAPGLSYRTDGDKVLRKDAQAMKDAGYEVHAGMLR